jgi:hypothetical protein
MSAKSQYAAFLRSEYWKHVQEAVAVRDDGKCRRCGARGLQVHHKTYEHKGEELEHLEDLELLCAACHAFEHRKADVPGLMATCFVCGSQTVCEHREFELLPTGPRRAQTRLIERKLKRSQQRQIEDFETQVPDDKRDLSLYEPNRLNYPRKRPQKAVDDGGKPKTGTE